MNELTVTILLRRDAAMYLSMLLDDQILSICDSTTPSELDELRSAYEHVRQEVGQALRARRPLVSHG